FQRNQRDSPLLRLPAELRNKIYRFVLGGNHIRPYCETVMGVWEVSFPGWAYSRLQLALLEVCRQVYAETKLLPFSLNRFVGYPEHMFELLATSLTPTQANALKTVYFYVDQFGIYGLGDMPHCGLTRWFTVNLMELGKYEGLQKVGLVWYDSESEVLKKSLKQQAEKVLKNGRRTDIQVAVEYVRVGVNWPVVTR
ncbi:hypothetical protein BDW02DRAFT_624666, partial [Decorospora gaudefroyi]